MISKFHENCIKHCAKNDKQSNDQNKKNIETYHPVHTTFGGTEQNIYKNLAVGTGLNGGAAKQTAQ